MADTEYRNMLREYQRGDISMVDRLVQIGLRNGFTLSQFRADGLPWKNVRQYLHLLNPIILTPEETILYQEMVIQEAGWHPDFVKEPKFFVPSSPQDHWSPCWPGNIITMHISFSVWGKRSTEGLSARKIRKLGIDTQTPAWQYAHPLSWEPTTAPVAPRISFWGADDTGMELNMGPAGSLYPQTAYSDGTPISDSLLRLDQIIRTMPNPVTKSWLRQQGFTSA